MPRLKSQSLVEMLVALGVGVILIGAAVSATVITLRSQVKTKLLRSAYSLAVKTIDDLRTISQSDWHSIYNLPKGESNKYYIYSSSTQLYIKKGQGTTNIEGQNFNRWFYVENVYRDSNGNIVKSGGTEDPSTQKATINVSFNRGGVETVTLSTYLTRWKNKISKQGHWEEGPGQTGTRKKFSYSFVKSKGIDYSSEPGSLIISGYISNETNIDAEHYWAWSDTAGWLDMRATDIEKGVYVSTDNLRGFGYGDNYGLVSFNCLNKEECSSSDYEVDNNFHGELSGWAWSEKCGWIAFSSSTINSSYNFGVTIDQDGIFHNYAWSENCGWLSFNCNDPGVCTSSDYYVKTGWTSR